MSVTLAIDDRTAQLAEELAKATGKSVADVVREALEAEAVRTAPPSKAVDFAKIREILAHVDSLPILDNRSADEIIGYDEHGLPT